jgi:putative phage-type endonuclease
MTDKTEAEQRRAWLEDRRTMLTASDVASVLGVEGAYGTPFSVWAEKVGEAPPPEELEDYLLFGRDVEGAVANGYSRKFSRPVRDLGAYVIQRHPDIPWLGATLDRLTMGSEAYPAPTGVDPTREAPAEFKAVGFSKIRDWREEPPVKFQIQVQIQMACTGAEWASLGAIFGGVKLGEPIDVLRHDAFLKAAYPRLEEFWLRVQRKNPPEIDWKPPTTEAIKMLFPEESGTTIDLGAAGAKLVADLDRAEDARKKAEQVEQELENKLKFAIGDASFATYGDPDGKYLHYKKISIAGRTQVVQPYSYRRIYPKSPKVKTRR